MKPSITAVIITKNEEKMVANCLETLQWCDEILVIDSGSEDRTLSIVENYDVKVVKTRTLSFAATRNLALSEVKNDWLIYIDADERVTPQLSKEILVQVETTQANALIMNRQNMMYGKFFEYGGWNENVTRVFRRSALKKWVGDIHESPVFEGEAVMLHTPLLHLTHRNTVDGLQKTLSWTPLEAKLLYQANIPPVTVMTLLRKGFMEFFRRAVKKNGRKDGMEGWVEAIVQGINRILVYIQVWELQQKPSLEEKYQQKELEIAHLWKKEK
jgi:(heptosyl)LPS beta-1,4-glucosyltransferase